MGNCLEKEANLLSIGNHKGKDWYYQGVMITMINYDADNYIDHYNFSLIRKMRIR